MSEIHPDDIDALVAEARRDGDATTWRSRATQVLARRRSAEPEGRREFLRLGATGAVAAAVLVACSDDEVVPPSETGVTVSEPTETTLAPPQTTSPEEGADNDALVFRTSRTLELAMIDIYDALLGGGGDLALPEEVSYDAATTAALELLRDRHEIHAEALVSLIRQVGGDPVEEPNNGILEGVVSPQLEDLTTQRTVLLFARSLEDVAAGTYGWGAGTLTTARLRERLMSIGAVTARHGALLGVLLDPSGVDAARSPVLDTSGPARLPEHMLVAGDQDGGDALAEPAPAAAEEPAEGEEGEGDDSGSDAGAPEENEG